MLNIGSHQLLQGKPSVALSFGDNNASQDLTNLFSRGLDIAEIRLDLFSCLDDDHINSQLKIFIRASLPTLLTIRTQNEGGKWSGTYAEYEFLIRLYVAKVDAVDIEINKAISSEKKAAQLVKDIKQAGKLTILSFHNFDFTPEIYQLKQIVSAAKTLGGDIIKIATQANSYADIIKLTQLMLTNNDTNFIIIAMGEIGKITRISMASLGSLITFSYLGDKPVALGQLHFDELTELLRIFYPNYEKQRKMNGLF